MGLEHGSRGAARMHRFLHRHPRASALTLGLVIATALVALAERVCLVLNNRGDDPSPIRYLGSYRQGFYVRDQRLGYRGRPSAEVTARAEREGTVLYDVTYTTDALGRRVTPRPPELPPPSAAALFFGCSFTFGEGVGDGDTLPAVLATLRPELRPSNLGFMGYGPQQMLVQAQDPALAASLAEPARIAVYTAIDQHVDRAIGSMFFATRWGRKFPHFVIDRDGQLVQRGDFESGRPVLSWLYDRVAASEIASYFHVALPPRLEDRHFALTARILVEARNELSRRLGLETLYVVLYPGERETRRLASHLARPGLVVLDYVDLFDPATPGFKIPGEVHPTPLAYRTLARKLAEDLTRSEALRSGPAATP